MLEAEATRLPQSGGSHVCNAALASTKTHGTDSSDNNNMSRSIKAQDDSMAAA